MKWAGNVDFSRLVKIGNAYKLLIGKPQGKRQQGDSGVDEE
jgi:hypothetical protein